MLSDPAPNHAWLRRLGVAASMVASVLRVCRERGFVRTSRLAWYEILFDVRNGTSTSLDIDRSPAAERHEGSNPLFFAELLRHVAIDRRSSVFLDYGAGKGRALILAAQSGFAKAIGVEVSPRLAAIARANVAAHRWSSPSCAIEIHCADAASFDVPDDVGVAFFFNPFGLATMRAVVDRITQSLARAPRELHVVYLNPRHADLFLRAGFHVVHAQGADGVVLRRGPSDIDSLTSSLTIEPKGDQSWRNGISF